MNRIKRDWKHSKRRLARRRPSERRMGLRRTLGDRSASGCGQARGPVCGKSPRTLPSLANSHRQLVDQVAALTSVVVELWELNNALAAALGLPRTPLPLAASRACVAWRGVDLG